MVEAANKVAQSAMKLVTGLAGKLFFELRDKWRKSVNAIKGFFKNNRRPWEQCHFPRYP
jgi:hypothetical protein